MFERIVRFEDGDYGIRAVLLAPWSSEMEALLATRQFSELEINYAHGWRGGRVNKGVRGE